MKPSSLRPPGVLLKLACAGLLLGGAAQARHDACDAAPNRASTACLVRVAATEVREAKAGGDTLVAATGVGSATAGATLALWQPERRAEAATAAEPRPAPEPDLALANASNDPPLLGLLLAALGVVGFVAHRRSGR